MIGMVANEAVRGFGDELCPTLLSFRRGIVQPSRVYARPYMSLDANDNGTQLFHVSAEPCYLIAEIGFLSAV